MLGIKKGTVSCAQHQRGVVLASEDDSQINGVEGTLSKKPGKNFISTLE